MKQIFTVLLLVISSKFVDSFIPPHQHRFSPHALRAAAVTTLGELLSNTNDSVTPICEITTTSTSAPFAAEILINGEVQKKRIVDVIDDGRRFELEDIGVIDSGTITIISPLEDIGEKLATTKPIPVSVGQMNELLSKLKNKTKRKFTKKELANSFPEESERKVVAQITKTLYKSSEIDELLRHNDSLNLEAVRKVSEQSER